MVRHKNHSQKLQAHHVYELGLGNKLLLSFYLVTYSQPIGYAAARMSLPQSGHQPFLFL
jgi:hypothetical protein